jgi:ankyrin repeat protein
MEDRGFLHKIKAKLRCDSSRSRSRTRATSSEHTPKNGSLAPVSRSSVDVPDKSSIWNKALVQVQTGQHWQDYCRILQERNLVPHAAVRQSDKLRVSDVIDTTMELQLALHAEPTGTSRALDTLTSIVANLKDWGDALTALHPYAQLAWAITSCVATGVQSVREIRALCLENIERVCELGQRYVFCEKVDMAPLSRPGEQTDKLEKTMVGLYKAILEYQVVMVITLFSRRHKLAEAFGSKSDSEIASCLSKVTLQEDEVNKLLAAVQFELVFKMSHELMNLSSGLHEAIQEVHAEIAEVHAKVDYVKHSLDSERRGTILNWISPFKYEDAHHEKKRNAMQNTGDWLWRHDQFRAWRAPDASRMLWLRGRMGCGKSCLVWSIIQRLLPRARPVLPTGPHVAYFYFDGAITVAQDYPKDTESIVRSFVKQVAQAEHITRLPDSIMTLYQQQDQKSHLRTDQCQDLLFEIVNGNPAGAIFVLDGLDECPVYPCDVQSELVSFFRSLRSRTKSPLKFLWASRSERRLRDLLEPISDYIFDVPAHNGHEIAWYIEREMDSIKESPVLSRLYNLPNEELREKTRKGLHQYSQGMFLWIRLTLLYVHDSPTSAELNDKVKQLHKLRSLDNIYTKMWSSAMVKLSVQGQYALRMAIVLTMYGGSDIRPWIAEAAGFARNREHDQSISVNDLQAMCPGLLTINEYSPRWCRHMSAVMRADTKSRWSSDQISATQSPLPQGLEIRRTASGRVYHVDHNTKTTGWGDPRYAGLCLAAAHFSVYEFLLSKHAEHFAPVNAFAELARLALEVLRSIEIIAVEDRSRRLSEETLHLVGLCATNWIVYLKMAKSSSGSDETMEVFLCRYRELKKLVDTMIYKAQHGEWVAAWVWHAPCHSPVYWYQLMRVCPKPALQIRILLDYRLNDSDDDPDIRHLDIGRNYLEYSPLHLAAYVHHVSAVEWLVQRGYDVNMQTPAGLTPAMLAIESYRFDHGRIGLLYQKPLEPGSCIRIVEALVAGGADLNLRDQHGATILNFVIKWFRAYGPEAATKLFLLATAQHVDIFPRWAGDEIGDNLTRAVRLNADKIAWDLLPRYSAKGYGATYWQEVLYWVMDGGRLADMIPTLLDNGGDLFGQCQTLVTKNLPPWEHSLSLFEILWLGTESDVRQRICQEQFQQHFSHLDYEQATGILLTIIGSLDHASHIDTNIRAVLSCIDNSLFKDKRLHAAFGRVLTRVHRGGSDFGFSSDETVYLLSRILLDNGFDPNERLGGYTTPMHWLVLRQASFHNIRLWLLYGAHPLALDAGLYTPLDYALITAFKPRNAKPNWLKSVGLSALRAPFFIPRCTTTRNWCRLSSSEMLALWLAQGGNPLARLSSGTSLLDSAWSHHDWRFIKLCAGRGYAVQREFHGERDIKRRNQPAMARRASSVPAGIRLGNNELTSTSTLGKRSVLEEYSPEAFAAALKEYGYPPRVPTPVQPF